MFIGSKSQRGRFKQKEGGRLRGTDYVFHFHFALCLNKQLPTALFSKPTFSQLLPGATERESHTQNVQGLLDFHSLHPAISVVDVQATWSIIRRKPQPCRAWLQSSTGRVCSDPPSHAGGSQHFGKLLCQLTCRRTRPVTFHPATTHISLEDDSESIQQQLW